MRRKRSCSSSVAVTLASKAGRPLLARPAASPCSRERSASRAESAKTSAGAPESSGLLPHERDDLRPVLRRLEEIGLVEDEHDLLAPLPDRLEEGPLALGVGTVGRGDEEHEIGPGQEVSRERLVLAQDRVRARRVHDREHAESVGGSGRLLDAIGACGSGHFASVAEDPDARGGGRHSLFEDARADERVDERALARVPLPHHHEQEGQRELLARVGERLARRLFDPETLEARSDL